MCQTKRQVKNFKKMKSAKKSYHFLSKYCLRTPLLPLENFIDLMEGDKIEDTSLQSQWENPLLREAIFLASPYLHEELSKWFNEEIEENSKKEKLKYTFLKYIIRASTRCTPFGLFAGISTGELSDSSEISLEEVDNYKRHTRLDMNYLVALIRHLEKEAKLKKQLLYFPNSTLYSIANQYRYIEYALEKNTRHYSVEAIEKSPYIEAVLETSKTGKTIEQLADTLIDDDISKEEAVDFIHDLIDNQLLVSQLEPSVTGKESFVALLEVLETLNCENDLKELLALKKSIAALDEETSNSEKKYASVFEHLDKIKVDYDKKYVLQTDLFTQTKTNGLSVKHAYSIKRVLPLLCKLCPSEENYNLKTFRKAFVERYEMQEVPLSQALDIETGIGYLQNQRISDTVPFLNDITPQRKGSAEKIVDWSQVDSSIYNKLLEAQKSNSYQLELSDDDFSHIQFNWEYVPDIVSAFAEIVKVDENEQLVLSGIHANAASLLGRFSYTGTEIEKHTQHITALEQSLYPDKILAEIVHLPESRTGNVLKRSHLRNYEIPYLAKSNLPVSQQIPLQDLMVSVRGERVVLRSKRLNKEVLPKLTNAHNYAPKALPIYHFLCDLQFQSRVSHLGFRWPSITEKHSFLPRVIYKNIILSKAKWNLSEDDIKTFLKYRKESKASLFTFVQKWRHDNQVPKYVQFVEHDNTLLIDLEHYDSIQLLLECIKGKKKGRLEEFLHVADGVVKKDQRHFTNECIITLYNQDKLKI